MRTCSFSWAFLVPGCDRKTWRPLPTGSHFQARDFFFFFFAGSTESTQPWLSAFPWINNPRRCGIKDNNRFLDRRHLSPTPESSLSLRRGAPVLKRLTRCSVTAKHCPESQDNGGKVLISHPFPCLKLLHMHWIYSHPRIHAHARCSSWSNYNL